MAEWSCSLFPGAREAGGAFVPSLRPPRVYVPGAPAADPERAALEAARRARSKLRRYCVANGLNRLGTLTYAGSGNFDQVLLREHVGDFFRGLRGSLGGTAFPYVWVPEWHKAHGLHVNFAVAQFVPKQRIDAAWGRGFVHIKLLSDLPVGSGRVEEARKAAGYLSKYVAKSFEDAKRISRRHRYEVAQGFPPVRERLTATSLDDLFHAASDRMGSMPAVRWFSGESPGWQGPPAFWWQW